MREFIIDGGEFASPQEFHLYVKEELGFPEYYGKNLSALYDCLTDISHPLTLVLQCTSFQNEEMEAYFARVLRVCLDAAEENENLTVKYDLAEADVLCTACRYDVRHSERSEEPVWQRYLM